MPVVESGRILASDISVRMGWTPLMEAASRGEHEFIEALIQEAASVKARDIEGRTALILAARAADSVALDLLINAGADLDL